MKKLIVILLILSIVLVGCGQTYLPTKSVPDSEVSPTEVAPTGVAPTEESVPEVILSREPPEDVTWISPGKVQVGNFYPGARAEWDLLIHNGKDTEARFSVRYRYPDHVGEDEGYAFPIEEVGDWVIIADSAPVLMPRETRKILIVLAMPKDAAVFAPKWEFWVSVKDTTQKGMVQTELALRWLITMRQ